MWMEVSKLFLAASLPFIDANTCINPDVDKGCCRFDNRVLYLCKLSAKPSAKGLI
jgi:hypothetical protein